MMPFSLAAPRFQPCPPMYIPFSRFITFALLLFISHFIDDLAVLRID
jgi:hypothetical protein